MCEAAYLSSRYRCQIVFPLANLVATGQVKLGDFVRIDLSAEGKMMFVKEAEGALVPVLLEKYGQEVAMPAAAAGRAGKSAGSRRDFGASPLSGNK